MVIAGAYIMDTRTEPGPGPLLNRELRVAEGARAGLGPPSGEFPGRLPFWVVLDR
jgi:hypothetical protein